MSAANGSDFLAWCVACCNDEGIGVAGFDGGCDADAKRPPRLEEVGNCGIVDAIGGAALGWVLKIELAAGWLNCAMMSDVPKEIPPP